MCVYIYIQDMELSAYRGLGLWVLVNCDISNQVSWHIFFQNKKTYVLL